MRLRSVLQEIAVQMSLLIPPAPDEGDHAQSMALAGGEREPYGARRATTIRGATIGGPPPGSMQLAGWPGIRWRSRGHVALLGVPRTRLRVCNLSLHCAGRDGGVHGVIGAAPGGSGAHRVGQHGDCRLAGGAGPRRGARTMANRLPPRRLRDSRR